MKNLLKKEVLLALHPTTWIFLGLSFMVLIPNYPYSVIFFYTFLSMFFTALNGRENRDVLYSLILPIAKRDVVRSRLTVTAIQQGLQLLLVYLLTFLARKVNPAGNDAGLDANLALIGWGLILYAVANSIFFGVYYRNVKKVGISMLAASGPLFLLVAVEVSATYVCPYVRDVLDTPDPAHLGAKLTVLAVGLAAYALSMLLTYLQSVKHFEAQDCIN